MVRSLPGGWNSFQNYKISFCSQNHKFCGNQLDYQEFLSWIYFRTIWLCVLPIFFMLKRNYMRQPVSSECGMGRWWPVLWSVDALSYLRRRLSQVVGPLPPRLSTWGSSVLSSNSTTHTILEHFSNSCLIFNDTGAKYPI